NRNYMDKLVRDNCYNYLETPVIVTSGESITPFFLNGEKVIGKNADEYKKFEMDPVGMYKWVETQLKESEEFQNVMKYVLENNSFSTVDFISGGRTRDWPFSAALAQMTGKNALFLYKPQDKSNPIVIDSKQNVFSPKNISQDEVFHIVDLVTTASSIVDKGGWLDQIHELNGCTNELYSIIDRNQGAREILKEREVRLNSAVRIDEDWLDKYDRKNAREVLEYLANPQSWSMIYLLENGLGCILPHLDQNSKQAQKDNRILKFFEKNRKQLDEVGLLEKIIKEIKDSVESERLSVEKGDKLLMALFD
ncbi:MAG: hypothetical protein KC589_11480, partial [Nanoarchaeota archaeon]|nr:hypothetical protein [Nanoarchaeota archaeon]